jgi:hypothetical protein
MKLYTLSVFLHKFVLRNGTMHLSDQIYGVETDFSDINLALTKSPFSQLMRISCSAQQTASGNPGYMSIEGKINFFNVTTALRNFDSQGTVNIERADLKPLLPYIKQWIPITHIAGQLDAHFECTVQNPLNIRADGWLKSDNLIFSTQSYSTISVPQFLCTISSLLDNTMLSIERGELSLPGLKATSRFSLINLHEESPHLKLSFSTDAFKWDVVKKHIPDSILNRIFSSALLRVVAGTVKLKDIQLDSTITPDTSATLNKITGNGEFQDVRIVLKDSFPALKLDEGSFSVNNGTIEWENCKARWYADDIHELSGKIIRVFQNPILEVSARSTCPSQSFTKLISPFIPDTQLNIVDNSALSLGSGIIKLFTTVTYPFDALQRIQFSTAVDITQSQLTARQSVVKPFGLDSHLTLSGSCMSGELPQALNFTLSLKNKSALISGAISNWSSPVIEGSYTFNNMDSAALQWPILAPGVTFKAIVSGNGTFSIPLSNMLHLALEGVVNAAAFELKKTTDELPFFSFDLQSTINGQKVFIHKGSGSLGKTLLEFSGNVSDWDKTPQGNFKLDASFLDLDDFIETIIQLKKLRIINEERSQKALKSSAGQKSFFRRAVIRADTNIKKGNFLSWDFTDGSTEATIQDGVMIYDNITVHGYRGIVNGIITCDFSQPDIYTLKIVPAASNIEFNEFFPELKQGKILGGSMNLDGTFLSTYRRGYEIVPHMTGGFSVNMNDIKFGKFTIISKIFSLVNFSEIVKLRSPDIFSKGMPFDTINGTFTMKAGTAHTENLFFKGPAMNLSAVGDILFPKKEIDFIVGVQPLETIARLIGKIPIAGTIFTGENKSITVSYFNVTGPYADPAVKPMPVESVSQGVITVFKRILKLPVDIF